MEDELAAGTGLVCRVDSKVWRGTVLGAEMVVLEGIVGCVGVDGSSDMDGDVEGWD